MSCRRRLIRSTIGGWVENRPRSDVSSSFLIGLTTYRCWVARLATSRGSRSDGDLRERPLQADGLRVSSTPEASARYSRCRLTASWTSRASDRGEDGEDDRDDEHDHLQAAPAAVARRDRAAAAPPQNVKRRKKSARSAMRPDEHADHQREPDVVVADVRQLVGDDPLELLAIELLEEAGRDRHEACFGSRPVAKAFGAVSSMR